MRAESPGSSGRNRVQAEAVRFECAVSGSRVVVASSLTGASSDAASRCLKVAREHQNLADQQRRAIPQRKARPRVLPVGRVNRRRSDSAADIVYAEQLPFQDFRPAGPRNRRGPKATGVPVRSGEWFGRPVACRYRPRRRSARASSTRRPDAPGRAIAGVRDRSRSSCRTHIASGDPA